MGMRLLASILLAACAGSGQAFEVASIKLNTSGERGFQSNMYRGEVTLRNVNLKQMIEMAYGVRDYSFSGPSWLDSAHFDVAAKAAPDTPDDALSPMLRTLLAERFKLVVHRESKTLSAYALTVAKGGLKIKEAQPGEASGQTRRGSITATRVSMSRLAGWLANLLNQPVVDKTETSGVFDIKLEFSPDTTVAFIGKGDSPDRPAAPPDPASGPSIFTALQEQLGLKLQAQKLPVDVLVVDHVERMPTEN